MSVIQSILIKRKPGLTVNMAIQHVLDMGFPVYKVDIKPTHFRFRQIDPNSKKYYYRTKKINKDVEFIIGFQKKK